MDNAFWTHWPEITTMAVISLGFMSMIGAFIAQGQRIDATNQRIDGLHKEIMELIKKMK